MISPRPLRWIHCRSIGDTTPDDRFIKALTDAGFEWLDKLDPPTSTPGAHLLWVGNNWDAGIRELSRVRSDSARGRTLVAGIDPPRDIGPRVRRAGGWTYLRSPPPGWLVKLLVGAIDRSSEGLDFDAVSALRRLAPEAISEPEAILGFAAAAAQQIGACDQVIVHRAPPPPAAGELVALHGLAIEFGQTIVIPDLAHSPRLNLADATLTWRAAVAIPVVGEDAARATGVIHLLWEHPRLPTPEEQGAMGALQLLCSWAIGRTNRRFAAARSHTKALRALSRISWQRIDDADPDASVGPEDNEVRMARAELVEALFDAYGETQQLTGLWARATPFTRADPPWLGRHGPQNPGKLPDTLVWAGPSDELEPVQITHGARTSHWALAARIEFEGSRLGEVVATFRTDAAARLARGELKGLTTALALGLRQLRRAADGRALNHLAREAANLEHASTLLDRMLTVVRDRMVADGAKIYLYSRTPDGHRTMPLQRTDGTIDASLAQPLDPDRGLVDWVLRNDDWLLVEAPVAAERVGHDHELAYCGAQGEIQVMARPEAGGGRFGDNEGTMLLAPLHSQGQIAGVLVVWRRTSDPFDRSLDVSSILNFGPQLAAACWRRLRATALTKERRAARRVAGKLLSDTPPIGAFELILTEAAKLAQAAHAVFLHHDPARMGHLYLGGVCSAGGSDQLVGALQGLHLNAGPNSMRWGGPVEAALRERLSGWAHPPVFRSVAPLPFVGSAPRGIVAFLDADTPGVGVFADDVNQSSVRNFLQFAGATLGNHVEAYASTIVERLSGRREPSLKSQNDVLQWAARLLKQALGVDAVLVYTGDADSMTVHGSYPPCPELTGFPVAQGSLTWKAIVEGRAVRILDVNSPDDDFAQALDRPVLDKMYGFFGWEGGRSWLSCPILDQGQCVGLVKALTSTTGRFLGPYDEHVATHVGHRAAAEFRKQHRGLMLIELNRLVNRLAGLEGVALTSELQTCLRDWVHRFIRSGVEVGLVALDTGSTRILLSGISGGPVPIERLHSLSRIWQTEEVSWKARTHLPTVDGKPTKLRIAGIALPFRVPGKKHLGGHLFLLHKMPFSVTDAENAREAAREIAVLVNAERARQDLLLRIGRFRHALLGPVQGLTSAARLLGVRVTEVIPEGDIELAKLISLVVAEAETIRLWRENQRLYFTEGRIEIRSRVQALKPTVMRCIDRYRLALQERGVKIRLDWRSKGALEFSFDREALDLSISNLLDNARKYSFYNREIVVGCKVIGPDIWLWVENVGHAIPERMEASIYEPGQRFDKEDPLRVIGGEGLGLPMAYALVQAHDGTLTHTCEQFGVVQDDHTPYLVRFVIKLPHFWSSRR